MSKITNIYEGDAVQAVPIRSILCHPTPLEIKGAVMDAIHADYDNPETPLIPMHVYQLIRDGFAKANRDFDIRNGGAA